MHYSFYGVKMAKLNWNECNKRIIMTFLHYLDEWIEFDGYCFSGWGGHQWFSCTIYMIQNQDGGDGNEVFKNYKLFMCLLEFSESANSGSIKNRWFISNVVPLIRIFCWKLNISALETSIFCSCLVLVGNCLSSKHCWLIRKFNNGWILCWMTTCI